MKVFIERSDEEKELVFSGKASELLKVLGINPESVLIIRGSEIVTEEDELMDEDDIRLIYVISGG